MIDLLEDIADSVFGNKRIAELKHFAQQKGFVFRRRMNMASIPTEIQNMEFFDGSKRKAVKGYLYQNMPKMSTLGQICDYYYYGDFGKKHTTLFIYDCDSLDLPMFAIKPKSSFSRLGSIFSSTEWSEVDSQFDKMFTVESNNMPLMRMTVTTQFADVMKGLENFTLEGRGDYMVLYKKNSKVDIIDMDNVYDAGLELLDIIIHDYSAEIL